MDVLSHFFIPYVAALFVLGLHRRPAARLVDLARRETLVAYAVVFGVGGFAPDIDPIFAWAKHHGDLYFLQHRGVTHTALFAPAFAVLCTFLLHALAVWRPQHLGRFRFRPGFLVAAILGSFTHLALDIFTYTGVPLWWPFSFDRITYPYFHYIVLWMFPVTLVLLGLHVWGRIGTRGIAWCGALLILALVVLAAVRVHYEPDAPEGWQTYPRSGLFEWTVVRPTADGYLAMTYDRGRPVPDTLTHYPHAVAPGTEDEVARARSHASYQGFRMGVFGPIAIVSSVANGTVHVTFTDVAARFEATHDPRWTPTHPHEAWGYVSFRVHEDRVEALHRGW